MNPAPNWESPVKARPQPRVARVSALEVAIRAQSKRFLAHPLVVQQLEAIWAGSIVFHSAADNMHRPTKKVMPNQNRGYGTVAAEAPVLRASPHRLQPAKQREHLDPVVFSVRRSVTLYDPKDASLFKLSRLRVPRYRQFLSTLSLAMLLGLYLAVLIQRALCITPMEVIFWFWSAGFMLDEVVGFNEQGFSLYIMSFWNAFDVGILMILICYYCMRLYGILIPDARKHVVANMAYDVLASNAVLLFPRLFSALDHYRYFSQLLIAFRMMAMDLVALFILIIISCSGFFVAFTLSFSTDDAGGVAYALFQMLMGFTPAAWDSWENYNLLGKSILTLFLFICHFLIVTILISVLTNSFMAIVRNANEEHQFVFAVNTISMVKSDALFSYIAPTNILAWILTPLRFVLPFPQFVRINRTVIKITHFPVLFMIYAYEQIFLSSTSFAPTDLVEHRGRSEAGTKVSDVPGMKLNLFSPRPNRLREPSVATFQKDRALDEVFRQPFRNNTVRNQPSSPDHRKSSNVINNWMQDMGPASPPIEQDRSILDKLEARRLAHRRSRLLFRRRQTFRRRNFTDATLSVVSDPEDFVPGDYSRPSIAEGNERNSRHARMSNLPEQTDADGDDELVTNDDDDNTLDRTPDARKPEAIPSRQVKIENPADDYFHHRPTVISPALNPAGSTSPVPEEATQAQQPTSMLKEVDRLGRTRHARNFSTNTVIHDPPVHESSSSPSRKAITVRNSASHTASGSGALTPVSPGKRSPKRFGPGMARPMMPLRPVFQSTPNLEGMLMLDVGRDRGSNFAMELGSDIGDNKAVGGGFVGAVPSSFATQIAYATDAIRAGKAAAAANESDDHRMMGKLMLARMNILEQGFREVMREVRGWRKEETRSLGDAPSFMKSGRGKMKKPDKKEDKTKANADGKSDDAVGHDGEPQLAKGDLE